MTDSIRHYFIQCDADKFYTKENFDIEYTLSMDPFRGNALSRICNGFIYSLQNYNTLPKIVVLVIEDDIINMINHDDFGITKIYTLTMQWLMADLKRIINKFNTFIPSKAKGMPHFLWIIPTMHNLYPNNNKRKKFGVGLKAIAALHENTSALRLVQVWNPANSELYLSREERLTPQGLIAFWQAVDKTIHFCDTNVINHDENKQRFQKKNKFKVDHHNNQGNKFALPRPPPK